MGPHDDTGPRHPEAPPPGTTRPPRISGALLLLLVFFGIALPALLQSFGSPRSTDAIRYDELLEYVRDGRVAWIHIHTDELQGAYKEGHAPGAQQRFVTGRVEDERLPEILEAHGVAYRAVPDSGWTAHWPWLVFLAVSSLLLYMLVRSMASRMRGQAGSVLAFGKNRGKVVRQDQVDVTLADVAGVEEAKQELQEIIEFLSQPQKYRRIGAKIPKGVLLVGPPGTGKTLLARAVAGEAHVPFISISGSEFVEMFVGVGAARVRDLFEQAARSAPCIVFIDELDALGRSRGGGVLSGQTNEEREQTLNQLLVEMDGFEPKEAVIIMAATNRPEILDPALLRPGRFDRQILVDRPDKRGRLAILNVHTKNVRLDDSVDLDRIAAQTPGFAGADLANLVNEAALLAARHDRERVGQEDFSSAIERVVAGLEMKSRIITEDEKRRVAYHEVGHALASTLMGNRDRVHKISVVPRGLGALGYTMQLPTEDRYLMTESEIRSRLVTLLGGRAAEQLVFGEASTGAQDDLQKATDIARAMVVDYGLSERVGPVSVGEERHPSMLHGPGRSGIGLRLGRGPGDRLADTIDAEVRRIVEEALDTATRLLSDNLDLLHRIAFELLRVEVLEGEHLDRLVGEAEARRRDVAAE